MRVYNTTHANTAEIAQVGQEHNKTRITICSAQIKSIVVNFTLACLSFFIFVYYASQIEHFYNCQIFTSQAQRGFLPCYINCTFLICQKAVSILKILLLFSCDDYSLLVLKLELKAVLMWVTRS